MEHAVKTHEEGHLSQSGDPGGVIISSKAEVEEKKG